MGRTESDDPQLRVYECTECGRAFARGRDRCPACDGLITEILLH